MSEPYTSLPSSMLSMQTTPGGRRTGEIRGSRQSSGRSRSWRRARDEIGAGGARLFVEDGARGGGVEPETTSTTDPSLGRASAGPSSAMTESCKKSSTFKTRPLIS